MEPTNVGSHGNVFIENDEIVDADTPLLPFRKASGSFWTSNDSRDHTVFGYTYPELQRWQYGSDAEFQDAVAGYIAQTYEGGVRESFESQQGTGADSNLLKNDRSFTEWTIEASAMAFAVPHTFVVQFFFGAGATSIHVGTWMKLMPTDKANEGIFGTQRAPSREQTFRGTVSLTTRLIDCVGGHLPSLDPKDVVPFLKKNLNWKILNVRMLRHLRSFFSGTDLRRVTVRCCPLI